MALEGTFADLPLVDLLEILHDNTRTGRLVVDTPSQHGTAWFVEGVLVDAVLVQRSATGTLVAEDALLAMLAWKDAAFVFSGDAAAATHERLIERTIPSLLEMHRQRNPEPLALAPDTTLRFVVAVSVDRVRIDLAEWRVLTEVALGHDVAHLIERVGIARDEAVRAITRLMRNGLIEPQAQLAFGAGAGARETRSTPATRSTAPTVGSALLTAILRRVRNL